MGGLERDVLRAAILDVDKDGHAAHVCRGVEYCDEYERETLGCGLLSQYRGRGTAIANCPGWLRTTLLWSEIVDLLNVETRYTPDRPHKLLSALSIAASHWHERAAQRSAD